MKSIKTCLMALAACLPCNSLAQQPNVAETSVLQSIKKYWSPNAGDWDAAFGMEGSVD